MSNICKNIIARFLTFLAVSAGPPIWVAACNCQWDSWSLVMTTCITQNLIATLVFILFHQAYKMKMSFSVVGYNPKNETLSWVLDSEEFFYFTGPHKGVIKGTRAMHRLAIGFLTPNTHKKFLEHCVFAKKSNLRKKQHLEKYKLY